MSDLQEYAQVLDAEATNVSAMHKAEIIADTECAQVVSEAVVSFPHGFDEKAGQATTCSRQELVTEEPSTFCKELDCVDDVSRGRHDTKFLPEGPFTAHTCRGINVEGLSPNVSKDERHEKRPRWGRPYAARPKRRDTHCL